LERVSRDSLDKWIDRAKPKEFLFFALHPVDRTRPANRVWITRTLRKSGPAFVRAAHFRHFAGDYGRIRTDKDFVKHAHKEHGISMGASWQFVYRFRKQRAKLPESGFPRGRCRPEDAYDLLFMAPPTTIQKPQKSRKRGRERTREEQALVAEKLHRETKLSWAQIAQRVDPAIGKMTC
jgi:hypothetical protein